jgi:hypothetical protein
LIKQNSGDEAPPLQEEEIVTTSHIVDEALQEHNNDEIKEAKD